MSGGVSALPHSGQPSPERSRQASRLLPELFAEVRPDRPLTLLDVGPAMSETVRYFSQFRCRLHIKDLYGEDFVRERQEELDEAELKQAFQDQLALPRGTLIDICLFWDFLNYLTPKALRALDSALRPYLHPGSRAHGFSVLSVKTPLSNRRYGILDQERLCIRPARRRQMAYFPHKHEELDACLGSFQIARGWLLADGRLEMLLEATV